MPDSASSPSPDLNRQWRLAQRPTGMLDDATFVRHDEPIPAPGPGEILIRNCELSVDPAMRGWLNDIPSYVPPVQIDAVMRAHTVGQVVESNHPDFTPGDFVAGPGNWQDYYVPRPEALSGHGAPGFAVTHVPQGAKRTWALGALGLTGLTAYFGLLEVGRPHPGDTVVVSGAAGATGSVVAQIAKIAGCRVIGIAGGEEKCRWLTDDLCLDAAIDYKSERVRRRLRELAPNGIDVFFDNVGGPVLEDAIARIAQGGRVVLCGATSMYNATALPPGPATYVQLIGQRARMEGFIVFDYAHQYDIATQRLLGWINDGRLKVAEDIQDGFDNIPAALIGLYSGANLGKRVVHIADPPIA